MKKRLTKTLRQLTLIAQRDRRQSIVISGCMVTGAILFVGIFLIGLATVAVYLFNLIKLNL